MNITKLFGINVASAGLWYGEGRDFEVETIAKKGYYRYVFQNGKLVGFLVIGNISKVPFLVNLIKNRLKVSKQSKNDIIEGNISFKSYFRNKISFI